MIYSAMEMHEIRYFLAASELLNFRRAAEKCHVSPPAFTRAIQKLEQEVGGRLFRRERNQTHLTDLGMLIRPQLKRISDEAEDAKARALRFLQLENAPIRIGVMCTIGPLCFSGFLAQFQANHPGIELTLIDGTAEKLTELLQNGSLDLAILAQPESFKDSFQIVPLYRESFCVAFPMGHKFQSREMIKLADAAMEPHLLRANCEFYPRISEWCHELGNDLSIAYRSEKEDWIQSLVAAGFGVTFLPQYSILIPGVATRRLVRPDIIRDISLASIAGRSWSPVVQTFARAVGAYHWQPQSLQERA
jgi:DNA-binding transcriptional LysR family regulator